MQKNPDSQLDLFQPVPEPTTDRPPGKPDPRESSPAPQRTSRIRMRPNGPDPKLRALSRKLLEDLGLDDLARNVEVIWNPRLRTTAGRAWHHHQRVELNPKLQTVSEEEVDRTLRHELAHLVAKHRAGRKRIAPHGPEWMLACEELGIPGEARCHDMDFGRARQKRRWAYDCPVCGKRIFRVRRIKSQAACYDCCRTHSRGHFDSRFRLIEVRLETPE